MSRPRARPATVSFIGSGGMLMKCVELAAGALGIAIGAVHVKDFGGSTELQRCLASMIKSPRSARGGIHYRQRDCFKAERCRRSQTGTRPHSGAAQRSAWNSQYQD